MGLKLNECVFQVFQIQRANLQEGNETSPRLKVNSVLDLQQQKERVWTSLSQSCFLLFCLILSWVHNINWLFSNHNEFIPHLCQVLFFSGFHRHEVSNGARRENMGSRRGRLLFDWGSLLHDSHWQSKHKSELLLVQHFFMFFPLSLSRSDPRSVPEPRGASTTGGGYAWTWPGSCSWVLWRLARLPMTAEHTRPQSQSTAQRTEHRLSFPAKQQSFTKHSPPVEWIIQLKQDWRHQISSTVYRGLLPK